MKVPNKSNGRDSMRKMSYDDEINRARDARKTQRPDTDPMIEKVGYLGVDDLNRMRRRKIK